MARLIPLYCFLTTIIVFVVAIGGLLGYYPFLWVNYTMIAYVVSNVWLAQVYAKWYYGEQENLKNGRIESRSQETDD